MSLLRASAGMLGGARRMGGSTITMQVARLRLGLSTTTLSGKFAQMARALQYEYHYGKGEILEAYFNLAPYGGNIEGVGAAARIYFRTTSGRLTRTESLALAVVPQNPVRRSPLNGPDFEAARARMQMLADAEDAPGGGQGRLLLLARRVSPWEGLPPLRVYGPARLPFGAPHVSSETLPLSRGGEPVRTCIDSGLQRLMRGPLPDSRHGEGVMA
ncbi:MAG: transglycosylase domain-containing protein [Bilophila wadsworthia]